MSFNPLKEKGIPLDKQLRTWDEMSKRRFNKNEVDCYSRTRQILMNGIEIEAWNFKHAFARFSEDGEVKEFLAMTKRIEDAQQTTINWMTPSDQSVLETTLGYEQVAVDLTAWMAQNEPDPYVKETFDFGLLEDFDHLYRYSQWAYMEHGICPNAIVQGQTDVVIGRPTQHHHNCNVVRLRNPYDKSTATPQTKINILTLISAEQQTHNFYAEHGMQYGNSVLRAQYAEIKDVEEEHVNMYESLADPTESLYEKLLLHEFMEVCNYHTCYVDEVDEMMKPVWEQFLAMELTHLEYAAKLFSKKEKRDPEEVIGNKIVVPNHFESQREYVKDVLQREVNKRLTSDKSYADISELEQDWASYEVQKELSKNGAPSENTIRIITQQKGRDIAVAENDLLKKLPKILEKGLQEKSLAPDTVTVEEYEKINKKEFEY